MSDDRKDGGPAYPTERNTQPGFYSHHGMSLRDWFAGQALAGLIGRTLYSPASAYEIADEMLAERKKVKP